ncbi:MAG: glucose-1-phosphate cytidylyltransferase [Paracoccaceae bacterium]|nr:glucose-1-phosphate cytidylyltransferase [Paracoccaceae bacterium]MDE2916826.1 glucose-1-phosphate cytidylyltransferase [Paracoccaceae bacterium]
MKVVILAGGLGSRISEQSYLRPKPMIEIGGYPILWHIMKLYGYHGFREFVICCGYKGYMIKEYFSNYFLHTSDVTFDLSTNEMDVHSIKAEPWTVTLVDTGLTTQTGGRLKRIANYLDETFCMTYGDGLTDAPLSELVEFHKKSKCEATITAVQPAGRFGILNIKQNLVTKFEEKPSGDGFWINGGFMVLNKSVIDRIDDDETIFERNPLQSLAADDQLAAWKYNGFWASMDTLRDKNSLETLWNSGTAPWKIWN